MKRPDFNAASVTQIKTNLTSNNTAVKLIDDKRNELTVNVSPPARVALAQALLTRPPVGGPGEPLEAGIRLRVQTFALFDHRGEPVLEILLAPNQAIHIALQGLQLDMLLELLQRYQSKPPPAGATH